MRGNFGHDNFKTPEITDIGLPTPGDVSATKRCCSPLDGVLVDIQHRELRAAGQ